jgi:hypothetical protein
MPMWILECVVRTVNRLHQQATDNTNHINHTSPGDVASSILPCRQVNRLGLES